MPTEKSYKIRTKNSNLYLRVSKGHFATSHSHINYYIDVSAQKARLSEAKAVAKDLAPHYKTTTIVDTILCLDGTEVIGACLANELTKDGYVNMNAHQTIYIVTPEHTTGSQLFFRDNIGTVSGICAIFATMKTCAGYAVHSVFNPNDLPGYLSCPSHDCPMCQNGEKIDALVNHYGFSKL